MNKLLRLTLTLFMWFNVLYADENDKLPLNQVNEYVYNFKGELSAIYRYDRDEILREKVFFYYDNKGILIKHIEFDEDTNKNGKLFAYEYSNGKLIKIYEAEERFTTSGIIKYEPIESAGKSWSAKKYEYNRYGNLVYQYLFINNSLIKKIKYEYENGKIIRELYTSFRDSYYPDTLSVCAYDSEQNLVESKEYRVADGDLMFDAKHHYDGNRLSHTITRVILGDIKQIKGKIKYEYDSNGRLIRAFTYGGLAGIGCIVVNGSWLTIFKSLTEGIHSKKNKMP